MIRLSHPDFGFVLSFPENHPLVLIVERPEHFRNYVQALNEQSLGQAGAFVLSKNWEPVSIAKSLSVITDVFNLDLNNRKLLGALHLQAMGIAHQADMIEPTHRMKASVMEWAHHVAVQLPYPVCLDEAPDISALLKAVNLRFDVGHAVETLEWYLQIMAELTVTQVICLVNCHDVFSPEELTLLWKAASYRKMRVMFMEPRVPQYRPPWERRYIVDSDLCELYPEEDARGF